MKRGKEENHFHGQGISGQRGERTRREGGREEGWVGGWEVHKAKMMVQAMEMIVTIKTFFHPSTCIAILTRTAFRYVSREKKS